MRWPAVAVMPEGTAVTTSLPGRSELLGNPAGNPAGPASPRLLPSGLVGFPCPAKVKDVCQGA